MNPRRRHGLEKLQVQLATAAVLAAAYFALWPLVRGPDPAEPLTFLAADGLARTAIFAAAFWALAVLCAAVTVTGRPQSGLIAALIGAGGLSLRSPQIRSLLWERLDSLGGLYRTLILEVLVLTGVLIVAFLMVCLVRRAISRLLPPLAWQAFGPELSEADTPQAAREGRSRAWLLTILLGRDESSLRREVERPQRPPGPSKANRSKSERPAGQQALFCLALQFAIATGLLFSLLRSGDRLQIVFALLASFFLAALIANQVFPNPYGRASWLLPVVLAVAFYALGAASAIGKPPQGWIEVSHYARALPIDWLTVGCGGAILGHWVSERVHDARRIESSEQAKGA